MEKIFEKVIVFLGLCIFLGFCYIVFNYNEIQYNKKNKEYKEPFNILTLPAPDWFRDTIKPYGCIDFSVIRLENKFNVKCKKGEKTIFVKEDFYEFPFKDGGYKYDYNSSSNILSLYLKKDYEARITEKNKYEVLNLINQDFLQYLEIGLENKDNIIRKKEFLMLNKDSNEYIMLKK